MKITSEEARRRLSSGANLASLASRSSSFSQVKGPINSGSIPDESNPNFESNKPIPTDGVNHLSTKKRARGPDIPEFVRDTMGALVDGGGNGVEIAAAFGVSRMAVSNAARGRSGPNPPNEERRRKLEERQLDIKDTALIKLMSSLNLLTEEKMEDLTAKDLSQVASNMSKVVHSIQAGEAAGSPVNIVIYSPEIRKEESFKVIDV